MTFDLSPSSAGTGTSFRSGASYQFDLPRTRSIIKVVGVGGGGSNAVNHMFRMGIKDVEFIICNTDAQALQTSPIPNRLQIGTALTEGLGCGANPEVGRAAAIESQEEIKKALQGAKMVFVTAGMGGGTGTGAAPVIAKIAREMGILTVGIVTMPFEWEGKKKISQAEKGVNGLRENCDTVLCILNTRLREMFGNLPIRNAFAEADNVLTTAAKGIAEIITLAGYVNVDFQDVRTVMKDAGAAVMGSAETKGEDRALNAARLALASPLLDNKDIMGAKKILLSIISGEEAELQMDELSEITNYIQEQAGSRCEVIFGHGIDPDLGMRIRVTVIATGFNDGRRKARKPQERTVVDLDAPLPVMSVQADLADEADEIRLVERPETSLHQDAEEFPVIEDGSEDLQTAFEPEFRTDEDFTPEPDVTITPAAADRSENNPPPTWMPGLFDEPQEPQVTREPEWLDESLEFTIGQEVDLGGAGMYGQEERFESHEQNDDIMEKNKTRERLEAQAEERRQRMAAARRQEMTKEEFSEKWSQPAFQRKGIRMENVPHSSQSNISRFNINDDNSLLGNNRFLHDNVD